jgi:hypothetical protein
MSTNLGRCCCATGYSPLSQIFLRYIENQVTLQIELQYTTNGEGCIHTGAY